MKPPDRVAPGVQVQVVVDSILLHWMDSPHVHRPTDAPGIFLSEGFDFPSHTYLVARVPISEGPSKYLSRFHKFEAATGTKCHVVCIGVVTPGLDGECKLAAPEAHSLQQE